MVSGILWIPDFQMFMLNFNKINNIRIITFTSSNQLHLGTMNPIEKVRDCYE